VGAGEELAASVIGQGLVVAIVVAGRGWVTMLVRPNGVGVGGVEGAGKVVVVEGISRLRRWWTL